MTFSLVIFIVKTPSSSEPKAAVLIVYIASSHWDSNTLPGCLFGLLPGYLQAASGFQGPSQAKMKLIGSKFFQRSAKNALRLRLPKWKWEVQLHPKVRNTSFGILEIGPSKAKARSNRFSLTMPVFQ